jgi:hypothetical protein
VLSDDELATLTAASNRVLNAIGAPARDEASVCGEVDAEAEPASASV